MLTYYPVWDISWLVAVTFTLGSIVWVLNGFFNFLPFVSKTEFKGQVLYGGGITAFIGATIFVIGSAFLMLEAVNENRTACFGWAVEHLGENEENEAGAVTRVTPATDQCSHHHQNTGNLVGKPPLVSRLKNPTQPDSTPEGEHSWVWWPSSNELRTHYFHDLGFMACLIQSLAATVFVSTSKQYMPSQSNQCTVDQWLHRPAGHLQPHVRTPCRWRILDPASRWSFRFRHLRPPLHV